MFPWSLMKYFEMRYWKLTLNAYQDYSYGVWIILIYQNKEQRFAFFNATVSREFSLFTSELGYRHVEKWLEG